MKMNKKLIIKLLVGFLVVALLLTYVSTQIYTSSLPIVTTTQSISAALQSSADAVGTIAYEKNFSHIAPVDLVIEDVYVKPRQKVIEEQMLLKAELDLLETKREQLRNQIVQIEAESEGNKTSETALLLQIEIAERELSLFKSNQELGEIIGQKNYEADLILHQEQIDEANLQLEQAQAALRGYQSNGKVDNEELALIRAIERINVQLSFPR